MSCFMNMIDYYLLRAVVSFCIRTKTAAGFSEVISCAFFGSSWSSDTALQVTCIVRRHMLSKFILFGCCHLFLPHSRLRSRVAEAMSSDREDRSRSPVRDNDPEGKKAPEDADASEGGNAAQTGVNQPTQVGTLQVEAPDSVKTPDEDPANKIEKEQPKSAAPPTKAEEAAGSTPLRSVVSASKSLEQCATQLETSVCLLEVMRSDSSTLSSLTAGVNVRKASQASAASNQKAIAWEWLSSPQDKTPLKESVKATRYHAEQTSKASFDLVATANCSRSWLRIKRTLRSN